MGIPVEKQDREPRGRLPVNDLRQCACEVRPTEGQEQEPQSHGATLTDKDGEFRLEMPQIIPIFGQPHGHLAYDSGEFKTVFLRPVMRSAKETSLEAHFVLQPV